MSAANGGAGFQGMPIMVRDAHVSADPQPVSSAEQDDGLQKTRNVSSCDCSWPICLVNLLRSVQAAPLAGTVLSRRGMQKLKLVLWRAETPGTAQRCGV
jgi:hypothetical protein